MGDKFAHLSARIEFLEQVMQLLDKDIPRPMRVELDGQGRAFRFGDPKLKHFVYLHLARVISGLNAGMNLTKQGYGQELGVVLRTLYEFMIKIEYVSNGYFDQRLRDSIKKYLYEYFSDFSRSSGRIDKNRSPRQKDINIALAENYERMMAASGLESNKIESAKLRQHLLSVYSNYVHGHYPEIMDMFGGQPISIHLRGMAGTSKDDENCLQLEAALDTADLTAKNYVRRFGYHTAENAPETIRQWANNI